MPEAFTIALKIASESDPRNCVLLDDLPRTTRSARQLGMYAILYGQAGYHPDADATLMDWADLVELLNTR
jgi:FMN phosphatase YigB (HAD superfamily)